MPATKTASTCTVDDVQGSHVFNIFRYSKHMGTGLGKFIMSGVFSVGGYDWAIRFYPDGFDSYHKDYIAVYLELLSKDAKVRASCDLRLVDQSTGLSSSIDMTAPRVFNQNNLSRFAPQHAKFKNRSEFEASAYLLDDHLAIECVVTVMKETRVSETRSPPKVDVPLSDITTHLGKLLESKETADVTFNVRGETFAAHRIILAMRPPVFKAELYGPIGETGTEFIHVKEMQPDVFKALLHFIYTDSLDIIDDLEGNDHSEMIRHLLVAADRYAMERLKLLCQSILCENLDVQNVATTLALADQHHCNILKDACIECISSLNIDDVVATQGYVNLRKTGPSILLDALVEMRRRFYKT
ncbi:BTB/POZ and MATH domain-containing protein 1-like [Lolium perenne]|uniref:BTB/POZ and MATH domain-containing protein 1-like n=1 Tax=Lolium perenne TaxID=4522 RepID=UPI0021F66EDA|nr:BTB/POZ and MATH domain-containing protein 1-like [Lolium perenne]